ncbi:hypothetical protein KIW84_034180 [Lathyrus oleraceus]|uniref:Reverse transcriptase zinc-binding domain-containing protein n=1 Tax=Pisum sativum TaxID=3888 RepID=A0A9D4XXX1_PEA|nr:hypothetical protein KIW84_034180 [Pisum sativum]
MGEWVDNSWIWDVKIKDDMPLQADEEAELESLLVILQDVRLNRLVDDSFVCKILIFGWRLLLNRLSTHIALAKMGIINGSENLLCYLCSAAEETLARLFLDCSIVLQVGSISISGWIFRSNSTWTPLVLTAVASLFCQRNDIVFHGAVVRIVGIVDRAKVLAWN